VRTLRRWGGGARMTSRTCYVYARTTTRCSTSVGCTSMPPDARAPHGWIAWTDAADCPRISRDRPGPLGRPPRSIWRLRRAVGASRFHQRHRRANRPDVPGDCGRHRPGRGRRADPAHRRIRTDDDQARHAPEEYFCRRAAEIFKAAPFRGNVTKVRASAISALALQTDTEGAGFARRLLG
jgi:hypothetical protein